TTQFSVWQQTVSQRFQPLLVRLCKSERCRPMVAWTGTAVCSSSIAVGCGPGGPFYLRLLKESNWGVFYCQESDLLVARRLNLASHRTGTSCRPSGHREVGKSAKAGCWFQSISTYHMYTVCTCRPERSR
ncbi:unnamed protein product, partial [Ectocarpus sp. 13 AM-2016]